MPRRARRAVLGVAALLGISQAACAQGDPAGETDPAAHVQPRMDGDIGENRAGAFHSDSALVDPRMGKPMFDWGEPPAGTPEALADAIRIVTRRDPSVRAAWSGARVALQQVRGAQWARFPALTTDLVMTDSASGVVPSAGVELPLWSGGRIGAGIDKARRLEAAAVARWREAVLDLAIQVNDLYFNIVLYTRLELLYTANLEEHAELVETMERRVMMQVSPQADLDLARSRAAQIEQELNSLRAQRLSALSMLAELISDPAYRFGALPQFNPGLAKASWLDVEREAVRFSPTRERLQFEADAAQSDIKLARSALFPQVNAQYSYNEITGSRFGVGVRMQTSNGLSQFSAVAAASSRHEQAVNQVNLAVRQLRQTVANEVVTQEAAVARAEVSARASETASKVSNSYLRQFIAGRRTWLDVMNSLREDLSSQANLAQSEVLAMSTLSRLNLRSGRWRLVRAASEN